MVGSVANTRLPMNKTLFFYWSSELLITYYVFVSAFSSHFICFGLPNITGLHALRDTTKMPRKKIRPQNALYKWHSQARSAPSISTFHTSSTTDLEFTVKLISMHPTLPLLSPLTYASESHVCTYNSVQICVSTCCLVLMFHRTFVNVLTSLSTRRLYAHLDKISWMLNNCMSASLALHSPKWAHTASDYSTWNIVIGKLVWVLILGPWGTSRYT